MIQCNKYSNILLPYLLLSNPVKMPCRPKPYMANPIIETHNSRMPIIAYFTIYLADS